MLLLCALVPATSGAQITFTASQPVTLAGERSGPDVFTAGGITKECPEVRFQGRLQGNSTTLELEPIYSGPVFGRCAAKALGGLPSKFAWAGCRYVLHPTGRIDEGKGWRADVDIECPDGSTIRWYLYGSEKGFKQGISSCATAMPSQSGLRVAELSNVGGSPGEISIHWNITEIEFSAIGSSLLCGPLFQERQDASYKGNATIAAKDSQGRLVDLSISDAPRCRSKGRNRLLQQAKELVAIDPCVRDDAAQRPVLEITLAARL